MSLFHSVIKESVFLWLAMSPYLLLGMFIAGIVHVFLGKTFITEHLGGAPASSAAKAALLGVPLPVCSCGVIPIASALRRDGARRSAVLSFLVSTPTTGVDSILATYSLMGPLFAIFRPLAALISGMGVGLFGHLVDRKGDRGETHQHRHAPVGHRLRIKEVFNYGFVELAADIGKWLIIGVVAGGILSVVIPEDLLATYFSNPLLHFLVVLAVAIPLYVCATGSIPIAAALIQKGFSPGAALVFLIAGPATNTVTLSFVYSKLGKRSFYVYLAFIVAVSLLLGWLFNLVWAGLGGSVSLITPRGAMLPFSLRVVAGVALLLLILNGFRRAGEKEFWSMKYTLSVPGMTCNHCKMTIENALRGIDRVETVRANVKEKMVGVDGDVEIEEIKRALADVGYEAEEESARER